MKARNLNKDVAQFVRVHLGRDSFAAFTSTDTRAWHAFLDLLELYSSSPGERTIVAMQAVVVLAQPKESVLLPFVQAIPAVLDWGHVAKIWPRVCNGLTSLPLDAMRYAAFEREGAKGPVVRRWGYQVPTLPQHAH